MENKDIATKAPPQVFPIEQLPPFAQECVGKIWEKYGTPKDKDIVITFYKGIYTLRPLPQDLYVHECVHFVRQGAGENEDLAKEWCLRYVEDPEFRLEEELIAYRAQYQFIRRHANAPVSFDHAKRLAQDLSGPMYGKIISFQKALNAIISQA